MTSWLAFNFNPQDELFSDGRLTSILEDKLFDYVYLSG